MSETHPAAAAPKVEATEVEATEVEARKRWMRTLSATATADLEAAWNRWEPKPEVQAIRGPEAGLVMVRGRVDAGGARFNLGEATVCRATIRLHGEPLQRDVLGTSYVLGSDLEHARLAALFDGLLCDPGLHDRVEAEVISPLERARTERDAERTAEARSTVVDFFTVAREHE